MLAEILVMIVKHFKDLFGISQVALEEMLKKEEDKELSMDVFIKKMIDALITIEQHK